MKCREAEGQFVNFLEEKLSAEVRDRIKIHLKGCQQCQGRLDCLKKKEAVPLLIRETAEPQKERQAVSRLPLPEPGAVPAESPDFQKSPSPLRFMAVFTVVSTLFVVGGLYFFTQGSTGTETNSLIDQKPIESANGSAPSSSKAGSTDETNSAPAAPPPPTASKVPAETERAPIIKKAGNGKPHDLLPKKAGNGKPHDLSRGTREKPAPNNAEPAKLLLISRDLKEAIQEIERQAAQSEGTVLEKRGGELSAKFLLLIPASRYDSFFQSLQQLGLTKETSKRNLPVEGSVKLEVTIE